MAIGYSFGMQWRVVVCGGVRRRAAMCGMEWDSDGNVRVFPLVFVVIGGWRGRRRRAVATELYRACWQGGANSLLFFCDRLTNLRWLTLSILKYLTLSCLGGHFGGVLTLAIHNSANSGPIDSI